MRWYLAAGLLTAVIFQPLQAKSAYTELTDPAQSKIFDQVTDSLICLCGCHQILNSCPHVDCPFAIPIRRFIEDRIREGMSAEDIIFKMENGFGPAIMNDPRVQGFARSGRDDLVRGVVHGFSHSISARTNPVIPALLVVLFTVFSFFLYRSWRVRRSARLVVSAPAAGKSEGLDEKLKEIDR